MTLRQTGIAPNLSLHVTGVPAGIAAGAGDVVERGDEARINGQRAGPADLFGKLSGEGGEEIFTVRRRLREGRSSMPGKNLSVADL
jgi:hypothetical protein